MQLTHIPYFCYASFLLLLLCLSSDCRHLTEHPSWSKHPWSVSLVSMDFSYNREELCSYFTSSAYKCVGTVAWSFKPGTILQPKSLDMIIWQWYRDINNTATLISPMGHKPSCWADVSVKIIPFQLVFGKTLLKLGSFSVKRRERIWDFTIPNKDVKMNVRRKWHWQYSFVRA